MIALAAASAALELLLYMFAAAVAPQGATGRERFARTMVHLLLLANALQLGVLIVCLQKT